MKLAFLLFLFLLPANAQQLGFGVKAGVRATDDITGYYSLSDESKRYIVGPMVDLRLPFRLGLEAEALYRPVGFTYSSHSVISTSLTRERLNSWEFPVVAKYRLPLPVPLVHPFAGVGYDWRTVHGSRTTSGSTLLPGGGLGYFTASGNSDYDLTRGVVVSAGIDVDVHRIRVSPEFRYVHWNRKLLDNAGSSGSSLLQSAQNEYFLMLGIIFH